MIQRAILSTAAICLGGYLLLCAMVFFAQESLIYFPGGPPEFEPEDMGLACQRAEVLTADGLRLQAWRIPAPESVGSRGTVLFCHGNAGNIAGRLPMAAALAGMGLDVVLFDYRGYGNSEGSPAEKGLYLDAEAVYDVFVTGRGERPERVLLYGESLGGAVALELCRRRPVAGLITESVFSSMVDMGRSIYPWLPVRMLLRHRFDAVGRAPELDLPWLIVHSADDEIVPFEHAQRLLEAAGERARLLRTAGSHNSGGALLSEGGREAISAFVDGLLEPLPALPAESPGSEGGGPDVGGAHGPELRGGRR